MLVYFLVCWLETKKTPLLFFVFLAPTENPIWWTHFSNTYLARRLAGNLFLKLPDVICWILYCGIIWKIIETLWKILINFLQLILNLSQDSSNFTTCRTVRTLEQQFSGSVPGKHIPFDIFLLWMQVGIKSFFLSIFFCKIIFFVKVPDPNLLVSLANIGLSKRNDSKFIL